MGLPVTVYRWDDVGAPQINAGKPSEIINVLKKCLVEGYGNKTPLGWSVAFESPLAYKIAFRNSTSDGIGGFFQLQSTKNNDTTSVNDLLITSASGMMGFDDFYNKGFNHRWETTNIAFNWYIIGTSTGFFIHLMDSRITGMTSINTVDVSAFIGEFRPFIPDDASRFTICAGGGEGVYCRLHSIASGSILCGLHEADGVTSTPITSYYNPSIHRPAPDRTLVGDPSIYGVSHKFSPVVLYDQVEGYDRNGTSNRQSNLRPFCRGQIPGFFYSVFAGYAERQWPVIESIGGDDYMLFRCNNSLNYWFKLSSW